MAVTAETVSLTRETVARMQQELRAQGLDGWLLYNFKDTNPVAGGLLGLPALTRRYFVLVPAEGTPVALTHRIEQQPWSTWIGEKREYAAWRELEASLAEMLKGRGRLAMEYTPGNAVPYVDKVPAGVIEMVRAAGAEPVSSGDLVSAFYSRWTPGGEASHYRAAKVVREVAHQAFQRIVDAVRGGGRITEWDVRSWIQGEFQRRGITVGADAIVANAANAANPHYAPSAEKHAELKAGDLVLIDLYGKEDDSAVYADQTWMGYLGDQVPARFADIFSAVAGARDAACKLVMDRFAAGEPVYGYEVDDASRSVIEGRGWGQYFIHRTGHSIDLELHGSGPNIDNLESRDTRRLIPGVGFSVEPGIYMAGDVGMRSEVDVYVSADGPVVTTDAPQSAIYALFREDPFA